MSEWISVEDQVPKRYKDVLIFMTEGRWISVVSFTPRGWERAGVNGYLYGVTHWMPLPDPPEVKK